MGNVKIVSASAGSGKTYNLAYEYIRNVIEDPSRYSHILAVTFTNKATEEMKSRILKKINELAQGSLEYMPLLRRDLALPEAEIIRRAATVRSFILHDYGRFAVLTIDKFFQRIIRAFIKELGIDLSFNIELPVDTLLGAATDRIIDDISTDDALRRWVAEFVDDKIADGRPWNIRAELLELGQELFKESYKRNASADPTDKIRLKKLVSAAQAEAARSRQRIITLARQWFDLIAANGLTPDDFLHQGKGVAGYIQKLADGRLDPAGSRVNDALNNGKWCSASSPVKARIEALAPQLTDLLGQMLTAYDEAMPRINDAALLKKNYRSFALLGDLYAKVLQVAKEENIVHISEINELLARLISGNDTPFVFEEAGNYFTHFMIDEFQDTSALQWENFLPLLHNATSQSDATPVLLVGDVKQSIYRWRGGDWSILAHRADTAFDRVIHGVLQTNYRSRPEIVRFINALIGACTTTLNAQINRTLDDAFRQKHISQALHDELTDILASAYADYRQETGPEKKGGYVTITCYGQDEVPPIIRQVEELQARGYAAGDIAILVRSNNEAAAIAAMLLEHKRLHPESPYCYDVLTQEALVIGSSDIVAFVIATLRLADNPRDGIRHAIYNRFLGRDFIAPFPDGEEALLGRIRLMPPEEAFEQIVMHFHLGKSQEQIAYLQALHEQIISFTRSNVADTPLFLNWWDNSGCAQSIAMPSRGNAITIDTIHKSKGLGYKTVIIPYCNWSVKPLRSTVIWSQATGSGSELSSLGHVPIQYDSTHMGNSSFSEDFYRESVMTLVDNVNLLYVALTRAEEELHLMMPAKSASDRLSSLIGSAIVRNGETVRIGDEEGSLTPTGTGELLSFGEPTPAAPAEQKPTRLMPSYDTFDNTDRLAVKFTAQRYFEEGVADDRLAPRNQGVLLHHVFEQATTVDDISNGITLAVRNGNLSPAEAEQLTERLDRTLTDPTLRDWFDGSWQEVRNEAEILTPEGQHYRPDRVMTRDGQAVVIDYKFGLQRQSRYNDQIRRYAELLRQMGYTSVAGYLWYVNQEFVEPVVRA